MKECALVTGAAKNTGYAIVEKFAQSGIVTVLTSRKKEEAEKAASEISSRTGCEIIPVEFDQGKTNEIEPLFKSLEDRGYLVTKLVMNAAAQGLSCNALEIGEAEWASVINTNVIGGFLCAREAAKKMIQYKAQGSILFIASNTAYHVIHNRSSYIASKGAILSMSRALSLELGEYGIRVNCLLPGPIHTDRWDKLDEETVRFRRNRAPLKKEASAEDIANAAFFLSGELSANTTGSELIIDGGMHIQLYPGM